MTSRAMKFHYAAFTPQLEISYRPIIDRRHDRLTGALALPRWSLDGMIVKPATLSAAESTEAVLRQMMQEDPGVARLMDIALKLEGLYRHASTHAAGVVIGDPAALARLRRVVPPFSVNAGAVYGGFIGIPSLVLMVAISALEILVAGIQAYVFALLTSLYINDAENLH